MNASRVYWYSTALLIASGLLGASVTLLAKHWHDMIQTIQNQPLGFFTLITVIGLWLIAFGLLIGVRQ